MFKKTTSILLTIILLALPSHCVLEETFVSLKESLFKIERPTHLNNHFGSTSPHKHNNEPDSHSHGEPHPIAVTNLGNNTFQLAKIVVIPVQGLLFFNSLFLNMESSINNLTSFSIRLFQETSIDIQTLYKTLTIAAQAPPSIY